MGREPRIAMDGHLFDSMGRHHSPNLISTTQIRPRSLVLWNHESVDIMDHFVGWHGKKVLCRIIFCLREVWSTFLVSLLGSRVIFHGVLGFMGN